MKAMLIFFVLIFKMTLGMAESPLVVGMELSYPPFEMMSPAGKPSGISVEIAEALGKYLHREILLKNIPYVGLIPSLNNGKIDLIISSMTITGQRSKAIDFSKPYLTTGLSLLVSKKSDLSGIEDANKRERVIAVKSGTSGEVYAVKHLTNATVLVLDKEASCVLEVVQGKADAFIYDQLSVYTNWQKNQETTRAILTPFQKEQWGIGVKKGNTSLLDEVNSFIDAYRKENGFEKLGDKYLAPQKEAFKKMDVPFVF